MAWLARFATCVCAQSFFLQFSTNHMIATSDLDRALNLFVIHNRFNQDKLAVLKGREVECEF